MKKFLLSFGVLVAFTFYVINVKLLGLTASQPMTTDSQSLPGVSSPRVVKMSVPSSVVQSQTSAVTPAGQYKDGTYTGSIADAYYGNIQVAVVVNNGKLTDVRFLDYPQDRDQSLKISMGAMPILKQEAIRTQNTQVDTVSGATATTDAFRQSLASALAQAKN